MPCNGAAGGCQANTGAGEFRSQVQSLECYKKFVGLRHVKPGPVVGDKEHGKPCRIRVLTDTNRRMRKMRGELPGIAQQVFQNDANQARVTMGKKPFFNVYRHIPVRLSRLPFFNNLLADDRQVNRIIGGL